MLVRRDSNSETIESGFWPPLCFFLSYLSPNRSAVRTLRRNCATIHQHFFLLWKLWHRHPEVLRQYCNSANLLCNLAHLGHAVEVDRESEVWVGICVTHVCPWNTNRRLPHHAFLECLFDFAVLYGRVILPDVASLEKLPLHYEWGLHRTAE